MPPVIQRKSNKRQVLRTAEEQHRIEPAPELSFPVRNRVLMHAATSGPRPVREIQVSDLRLFRLLSTGNSRVVGNERCI